LSRSPGTLVLESVRHAWQAHALLAAHRLGLFQELDKEPCPSDELARRLHCNPRGVAALLDTLGQVGLVRRENDVWMNCAIGDRLAAPGSPLHSYLELHAQLEAAWSNLTHHVRDGGPAGPPFNHSEDVEDLRVYLGAMHALGEDTAPELAAVLHVGQGESLLDMGGGTGVYARAILRRCPEARAVILERPVVCEYLQEAVFTHVDATERPELVEDDYFDYDGREQFDWVLAANVVHNETVDDVRRIFRSAFRCLRRGGRLAVLDYFASDDGHGAGPAGFELLLHLITDAGRVHGEQSIRCLLEEVGFTASERARRIDNYTLLLATKRGRP